MSRKEKEYKIFGNIKTLNIPLIPLKKILIYCFCCSGTTLKSAQINKRNWIGIDQSDQAIQSTKNKIKNINIKKNKNNLRYEFIRLDEIRKKIIHNEKLNHKIKTL